MPHARVLGAALCIAALLVGACLATAQGQTTNRSPERAISMDFDGVDIRVFAKFISEVTGRNFILDEKLRGKVTILSPEPVNLDEAYKVFESVIEVYGYTAVDQGKIVKIMPAREGKKQGIQTYFGDVDDGGPDTLITQVKSLSHLDSTEVRKMLSPLMSNDGLITEHPDTNTLIIIDHRANVKRLLSIVGAIDQKGLDLQVTVFDLEHASAEVLAGKLSDIAVDVAASSVNEGGEAPQPQTTPESPQPVRQLVSTGGDRTKIVAYERTNALIVVAGPRETEQIRLLIEKLDQPASRERGNLKVYFLVHADAAELAEVLAGIAGGPAATGEGEAQPVISDDTRIVADTATNSLVVTAPPQDFEALEEIIAMLDTPRRQVYVEALIMEMSTDKSISYGVSWTAAGSVDELGSDGGLIFGGSNPTGFTDLLGGDVFSTAAGLSVGAVSFPITIDGITFTNLQALIEAAQTDNEFNVISTPQLMTLDNEEASIIVAENRPFLTSQDVGQNEDDRTNQQFEYRDVGTTLKVTPQISEGGVIKLAIYQETSRVDETITEQTGALQPTTRKRTTETTVLVNDGQTIIISGLIGTSDSDQLSKVPLLGDVPVLGWLFKAKRATTGKTNLLVFLTPRIVAHPGDVDALTYDKMTVIERVQFDESMRVKPIVKGPRAIDPAASEAPGGS